MKRHADSAEVNEQLWYYRNDLRDGEMGQLLRAATEGNREELGAASGKKWEKWFNEDFKPDAQNTPN
jgi:hypothetical protein